MASHLVAAQPQRLGRLPGLVLREAEHLAAALIEGLLRDQVVHPPPVRISRVEGDPGFGPQQALGELPVYHLLDTRVLYGHEARDEVAVIRDDPFTQLEDVHQRLLCCSRPATVAPTTLAGGGRQHLRIIGSTAPDLYPPSERLTTPAPPDRSVSGRPED